MINPPHIFECRLCGSPYTALVEQWNPKLVINAYRELEQLDVSEFFTESILKLHRCNDCSLLFFDGAKSGTPKFYEEISRRETFYSTWKPEYVFALKKIAEHKPKSVFDYGCGPGFFLKQIPPGIDRFGYDANPSTAAELRKADIHAPAEQQKFDFVAAFQVLEHVDEPLRLMQNLCDKLATDGRLFVSTPNASSPLNSEIFAHLDFPPHHLTRWTIEPFHWLATKLNLEIECFYEEKMSLEEDLLLRRELRKKIFGQDSWKARLICRLGQYFDWLRLSEPTERPGRTHGILYRKKRGAVG
jgi:SAM-dependent methyltransferase